MLGNQDTSLTRQTVPSKCIEGDTKPNEIWTMGSYTFISLMNYPPCIRVHEIACRSESESSDTIDMGAQARITLLPSSLKNFRTSGASDGSWNMC